MPDLDPPAPDLPAPDPMVQQLALLPGAALGRARRVPDDDDDERRDDGWVEPDPGELVGTARGLLESLLHDLMDEPEPAVAALLRLGEREGQRRRDAERDGPAALADPLVAAVATRALVDEVGRVLAPYAAAPLPDEVAGQAALGVEFVAGVEASSPGAVEASGVA